MNAADVWTELMQIKNKAVPFAKIVFNVYESDGRIEIVRDWGWIPKINIELSGGEIVITSKNNFLATSCIDIRTQPTADYDWLTEDEIRVTPVYGSQGIFTVWITKEK
jgi:hypothetical protein